jgi:MFS transporter, FHS family, L-fucose permease
MTSQEIPVRRYALIILTGVFFFWGFVAASNDILIPVFKEKLTLEQWQSQMIAFVFYVAYTLGSLIYLGLSRLMGADLIGRFGYGKGIAFGLLVSALGTLLFIPAANQASFPLLLGGLLVVGLGFSLQQTAANPLAIALGTPETASQRLSLAGAINNVGTTIGPLLVSLAIFGELGSHSPGELDVTSVKLPYLGLGLLFVAFAAIFWPLRIPSPTVTPVTGADSGVTRSAIAHPQLWMGMIAIFLYVGVEVSTAANLPELMKQELDLRTERIAPYISLFWASLMIGRWTSASGALGLASGPRQALRWILPLAAFGLFLSVNIIAGYSVREFAGYLVMVLVLILADIASKGDPARQLLLYSLLGIGCLVFGIFSQGILSVMAFIAVGLFCSTLWPCIFTLAIRGLGSQTSQGSNLLIMMIMGGGFVSVFQGYLADQPAIGIRMSYWVGVACFAYLAFYAWRARLVLARQGFSTRSV